MDIGRSCAVICLMVGVSISALAADSSSAIEALKKNGLSGDIWLPKTAISADFTCDGKPDLLVRGRRGRSAIVGLLASDGSVRRPDIIDISVQDLKSVRIVKESQVCEDEAGYLDGCKPRRGCFQFRVERDDIDSLHCWWHARHKKIRCWMR
jgi:hypothetical protein